MLVTRRPFRPPVLDIRLLGLTAAVTLASCGSNGPPIDQGPVVATRRFVSNAASLVGRSFNLMGVNLRKNRLQQSVVIPATFVSASQLTVAEAIRACSEVPPETSTTLCSASRSETRAPRRSGGTSSSSARTTWGMPEPCVPCAWRRVHQRRAMSLPARTGPRPG